MKQKTPVFTLTMMSTIFFFKTEEKTLKRNGLGQLGFHINADAIVTDVENNSFAHEVGLLKGSRLVEICKVASTNLSHEDMVDLLRTSQTVKVTLISPMADGTPRYSSRETVSQYYGFAESH